MVTIVTVLKSGKEYNAKHAQWLHNQLPRNIPSVCISDVDIEGVTTIPLRGNWPGWWSKMEMFDPKLPKIGAQDIFFLDLDTVIVGDISPLMKVKQFTTLTDFYREGSTGAPMASAVMYIPVEVKHKIWSSWLVNPEEAIRQCNRPEKHGDQGFIGSVVSSERWQNIIPGAIVSYKKDVASIGQYHRSVGNGSIPEGTRIVCFHGKPRPWDSNEIWVPSLDF